MHCSSVFICLLLNLVLKVLIYDCVKHFHRGLNYSKSFVPLLIDPETWVKTVNHVYFKSVFYVTTGSSWMSFINAQRSQSSCKVTQPFECHPLAGPRSNWEKNMLASHLLIIIINNAASKSGLLDLCPFFLFFRASGLFINNSYVAYLHFHIVEA